VGDCGVPQSPVATSISLPFEGTYHIDTLSPTAFSVREIAGDMFRMMASVIGWMVAGLEHTHVFSSFMPDPHVPYTFPLTSYEDINSPAKVTPTDL